MKNESSVMEEFLWKGNTGFELSWRFQHLAQGPSCLLLLNTAVPRESMTMAFMEPDECISIFSLYIFFLAPLSRRLRGSL